MQAKKRFGQNFLKNEIIINNIINLIQCNEDDLVIEIGPGRGALTKYLSKINCQKVCIEIDTDMKSFLSKYESDKLKIIYNDILQCDIKDIIKDISYNNLYVIGNLPYYITSPIISYLIESGLNITKMIFMVQDEVAKRFTSNPGSRDYGYMTVFLNNYFDVNYEFFVSKDNFDPIPKVDSAIISFDKKSISIPNNYFKFLKDAFSLKRKTLKNNLKNYDFKKVLKTLEKYGYDQSVRAEELSDEILKDIFINL